MKTTTVLIVDGNWVMQRFWQAGSDDYSVDKIHKYIKSQGELINADKYIILFDLGKSAYRTAILKSYKGNRAKKSDEQQSAFQQTRDYFVELAKHDPHYTVFMRDNTEADDLACKLCKVLDMPNVRIYLLSIDHDWFQMLDGDRVIQIRYSPIEGTEQIVTEDDATATIGFPAKRWAELAAFGGDASDNVPATGISKTQALKWLKQYNSLLGVWANEPEARAVQGDLWRNYKLTKLTGDCVPMTETDENQLRDWVNA